MSVNLFINGALTKIARGLKDVGVIITNNLLATKSGTALDAVQGKILNDKINEVNTSLGFKCIYVNNTQVPPANSCTLFSFSLEIVDGYVPIGILGIQIDYPGGMYVPFYNIDTTNNALYYYLRNTSSEQLSNTTKFKILYVKATSVK